MRWILSVGLHGEEGEDDMTERERLIELLKDGGVRDFPYVNFWENFQDSVNKEGNT